MFIFTLLHKDCFTVYMITSEFVHLMTYEVWFQQVLLKLQTFFCAKSMLHLAYLSCAIYKFMGYILFISNIIDEPLTNTYSRCRFGFESLETNALLQETKVLVQFPLVTSVSLSLHHIFINHYHNRLSWKNPWLMQTCRLTTSRFTKFPALWTNVSDAQRLGYPLWNNVSWFKRIFRKEEGRIFCQHVE